MDRRRFGFGLAAAVLAGSLLSARGQGPEAADADSYAIWSMLIPVLQPGKKAYLIPSPTYDMGMVKELRNSAGASPVERRNNFFAEASEIEVPVDFAAAFAEAAAAFKALREQRLVLADRFHLPQPCRVMDAAAMEEYRRIQPPACVADAGHPWHRDRGLERKYASFGTPCWFSRVFFDKARSLGLVWAEGADGSWKLYAFGKTDGGWKRLNWPAVGRSYNC